jgi:uncharacterized damage-inducible protein DinB
VHRISQDGNGSHLHFASIFVSINGDTDMSQSPDQSLLEALLDSWDRNNTIMVGLLHALPTGGLKARATPESPTITALFMHVCYLRFALVCESDPEFAAQHPEIIPNDDQEWLEEYDLERITKMLNDSAKLLRDAVKRWIDMGQSVKAASPGYDHPILLLQHMIWHEGYHVGQMKLALKITGRPMTNKEAGAVTWSVWWRHKE